MHDQRLLSGDFGAGKGEEVQENVRGTNRFSEESRQCQPRSTHVGMNAIQMPGHDKCFGQPNAPKPTKDQLNGPFLQQYGHRNSPRFKLRFELAAKKIFECSQTLLRKFRNAKSILRHTFFLNLGTKIWQVPSLETHFVLVSVGRNHKNANNK